MNKRLLWIFLGAFLFRLILAFIVWHPDINNHIDWGIRFFQYGPGKFFAPESNVWNFTWPNQPPGTIYMFAGIRKLFEFVFNIFWIVNIKVSVFPSIIVTFFESNLYPALLKLPSILSDIGIGVLIYKIVSSFDTNNAKKKAFWATIIWLVNPVVWYNSAVWGQTDAVINFLALLSFYLLFKKKIVLAVFFLAISFYVKVSLTIFLPIFAIVALRQKYKFFDLAKAIILSLGFIALATLPFAKGEPLSWLLNLYQTKVLGQQLQVITANSFNIWTTIATINERPQTLPFLGLTYQYWSYILFAISYIPLLVVVWKKQDSKTVLTILALAAFSSWMLLTNMHERYLYPLFPYLTILLGAGITSGTIYWTISIVSLLNLYNFWWVPKIDPLVWFLSFGERIMPRVLGLFNFGLFLFVYNKSLRVIKVFAKHS